MALSDILIYRDYPVINGYVQYPINAETRKTAVTVEAAQAAIAGSVITRLSLGSGRQHGRNCGQQEWLRLPGTPADQAAVNYQDDLDAL